MPKGKTVFNREWARHRYTWVREVTGDRHRARCGLCFTDLDIGSMGESALKLHAGTNRHKRNELATTTNWGLSSYGVTGGVTIPGPAALKTGPSPCASTSAAPADATARPTSVSDFVTKNEVLRSEIIWTICTVMNHFSYKSNDISVQAMKLMFPDSTIASKFTCGERKSAYLCVYGIAEHFKTVLLSRIKGPFTVLFDESLNKKIQEKQMDIHVRFWDNELKQVVTRYLGSQFMGKFS